MSDAEQFLSNEEIRERLSVFEAEEFPPDECIRYAEVLAKYCRGEATEGAIRILVENFPDDRLSELVNKHVAPALSPDCAKGPWNALAYALKDLGIETTHSTTGWTVSWSGGDALEGENLCRLALLAVWFRGIQQPGGEGHREAGA